MCISHNFHVVRYENATEATGSTQALEEIVPEEAAEMKKEDSAEATAAAEEKTAAETMNKLTRTQYFDLEEVEYLTLVTGDTTETEDAAIEETKTEAATAEDKESENATPLAERNFRWDLVDYSTEAEMTSQAAIKIAACESEAKLQALTEATAADKEALSTEATYATESAGEYASEEATPSLVSY